MESKEKQSKLQQIISKYKINITNKPGSIILKVILACIYSVFFIWGYQINARDSVSYFKHTFLFLLLAACFYFLISGIDILVSLVMLSKDSKWSDRQLYIAGVCIMIVWVIVWLALFPGLAIYDGPTQLWQFKQGTISTHHPYIHSAFLALCDALSNLLHFEDYSFFNSLFQLIFQWICYMRILFTMRKLNCKSVYLIYTIVFMALYPPNAFLALTTTKDTIFTGFFILLLCEIAGLYTDEELSTAAMIRMIIFGAMMSIFRNNGFYVFIAAFPFVLLIRSKIRLKKWAVIYCSVLILSLLYSGIVSNVLHIRSGDAREAMSAIIQPLARIYQSIPGELSLEEKVRIQNIFGGNEAIPYNSYVADDPKLLFDTEFFMGEFRENMTLFLSLAKRYPTGFMDAWLATYLGNYYPLESLPRPLKVYYEIPLKDQGHSLIPWLYDKIADFAWNSSYRSSKLLTIWLNSGIVLWKLLYLMYFIISRKKTDRLALCSFPFMLFGTMFLAAGTVIRYTQPITVIIPLIFSAALYADTKTGSFEETKVV